MRAEARHLRRQLAPAIAALALLAGCATPAPTVRAPVELPQRWSGTPALVEHGERWWLHFGDATLERLIDEALASNLELEIAAARILQARAAAGIAESDRYPAIGASASSRRSRSTLEGSFPLPPGTPRIQTTHRIGLDASFEVDFWGRYASADAAARAELLAAEWARQALRLTLSAELANRYHALVGAGRAVATLERTLEGRREAVELLQHRVRGGTAGELDIARTRAEIAGIEGQLAQTLRQREEHETALALLLGRSPRALFEDALPREATGRPPALQVPAGLPSELLLRRPDLRQAEQTLAAADARVDEARALLFPSISLTASLGQESVSLARLFSGGASIFGLGVGLAQPIWNAGRLQANLDAVRAQRLEAEARYRQAIADAFADVRRALAAQHAAADSMAAQQRRIEALRDSVRLARLRLEAGITGRFELLEAERDLLQAELAASDALTARQTALADLARALGGGWMGLDESAVAGR